MNSKLENIGERKKNGKERKKAMNLLINRHLRKGYWGLANKRYVVVL